MEKKPNSYYNIVLIGQAGAGKGTQAGFLKEEYNNLYHISMGDVMRMEVQKNTEYAEQIKQYQKKGKIVPDQITINLLKKRIKEILEKENKISKEENHLTKFILDGYPRSIEQSKSLNQIIDPQKTVVVKLNISNETATRRIQNRAQSDGINAREDDKNPKTVETRLADYDTSHTEIEDILKSESNLVKFIEIQADKKSPNQVFTELNKQLMELNEQFESAKPNGTTVKTNGLCEHILK